MKKIIVASDSFKGTLSSAQICTLARREISVVFPGCEIVCLPIADGGEGTVDCFLQLPGAEKRELPVMGPLGEPVKAAYAVLNDGRTAVLEMAAAAGLPLVGERKDPGKASTYGVGELMRHAVESGCRELLLGLGGSATNDGGCGAAAALGVRFLRENGQDFLPVGNSLREIAAIDASECKKLLQGVSLTVMCDVTNPLCGPRGAAAVFGPQKGADPDQVEALDAGLRWLSELLRRDLGFDGAELPGAGAAGGMGAGCMAFFGGRLRSGIDAVLDTTGFDAELPGTDLVITGEGRIDGQSVHGKVIDGITRRTKKAGVPVVALVGCVGPGAEEAYEAGVTAIFATNRAGLPFAQLKERCETDYARTLADVLQLLRCSRRPACGN